MHRVRLQADGQTGAAGEERGCRVCGALVLLAGVSMSLSLAWDGEAASLLAPAHALPAQTHTHEEPQDK